jgi:dCMP deaminase
MREGLKLALAESWRGTCDRANVGCVLIAPHGLVIGQGHNTAPAGSPVCDDVGHLMHEGHCCRATHAEINALANAVRRNHSCVGATAYVTHAPCPSCAHALLAHGIGAVVYLYDYDASRFALTTTILHDAVVPITKGSVV